MTGEFDDLLTEQGKRLVEGMEYALEQKVIGYEACGHEADGRCCRKPKGHDGGHAYF